MAEFWELNFQEKQTMWGFEPSQSAILVKDFFIKEKIEDILIPGFGYGRNAKIFLDNGFRVTGIEISKTAIDISLTHIGSNRLLNIIHGSVTEMPFDDKHYEGIFCYGLLYLLNSRERNKFIADCYKQLKVKGYMIFVVISKENPMYGKGKLLSKDRFEIMKGLKMFFYDSTSISNEFKKYGLFEISEINEPQLNKTSFKFFIVKCKKD